MKKIYCLLIFCFTAFQYSHAQWTTDANLNTEVKDSVGPEESVPISATTTNGSTFISYFAYYNGGYEMRLQLLDPNGNKLFGSTGLLVSNQPQNSALFRYDMKVDADDNAIIAFQDERTGSLQVVAYKINMLGNFLWGANGVSLIDTASTQGLGPTIGITNSSNVVIGWNASSSSYKWVALQKISPAGTLMWAGNLRVYDASFTHKYSRPTFAPAGTDDIIMLYADETGAGLPPGIMYAQRYDVNGNTVWTNAVQVSSYTIPFFFFQKAVSDYQDGFYVGFNTSNINFPTQGDVYMQHVDGNGNLWNATGNLACALTNTQKFTAAVHDDPLNNSIWVLLKTTDVNQGMSGAAIQRFDAAGNVLLGANASQLASISAAYYDPNDFCITNDGVISFYTTGNYPNQTIQAVKNDFSGTLLWSGTPVDVCTRSAGKDDHTTGLFANNQAVLVWDDNRNDYGVYAQNITNDGQIGVLTSVNDLADGSQEYYLSPNPAQDRTTLFYSLRSKQYVNIEITNALGEVVLSFNEGMKDKGENTFRMDIAALPKGIYFVRLANSGDELCKKLIRL